MKPTRSTLRLRKLLLAHACATFALSVASAQQTKPDPVRAAQDAQALAKYDKNKNGKLDPDEVSAMAAETSAAAASSDILLLTPFQVDASKDKGYAAENTLAGSRLNSKLEDLAASITVVTKQQLQDTGSVDINDVFKYEAGTEGSATYTPVVTDRGTSKDTIAGYSLGNNGDTTTNAQSNRVRGINAPDSALNNYPTNNRIPFDSYNVQSIEITRGPNSLLFGLGSSAGIVNQSAAQAVLNRNTNEVVFRTDQNLSVRSALSINRSLIADKLAFYGAILYDDRQFERKPSRDLYRRQYGALTYKPFSKTIIRGFAENYQNDANRPNFLTPRDFVTPWLKAGRPAYDPTTRMVTILDTGVTVGPYVNNTQSPGFVAGNLVGNTSVSNVFLTTTPANTVPNPQFVQGISFDIQGGRPIRLINGGTTVDYFLRQQRVAGVDYPTAQTNPATTTVANPGLLGWVPQDSRYLIYDRFWSASTFTFPQTIVNPLTNATAPTVNGVPYGSYQAPAVTNKSIYDWTKKNLVQTNWARTKAANYNIELEQQITQDLFFTAGWFRQDIESVENYTMGQLTGNTISIDTNTKLPDGRNNPYFGLPFIYEGEGGGMDTFYNPQTDDNVRAMLAYDLNLSKHNNFLRYLGRHRLTALWTAQNSKRAIERWRNGYVDGDPDGKLRYLQNFTLPGQQLALNGTTLMRKYYLANPGDPQATVTHSSGFFGNAGWDRPVTSQIEGYNYTTGQFQNNSVVEQANFSSAGSFRTEREVRSWTLGGQSYLWEDRLIATLGWRHDEYRARITTPGALTDVNGVVYEPALPNDQLYLANSTGVINHDRVMSRWWRWDELSGNTKTYGFAFRPLKGWSAVQRIGGEGSVVSEFLNGLTLYYNQSENFNPPATFQTDFFKKPLAKPTGKGRDGGFGFNIMKNKLVARINWYDTSTENERTGSAGTLLGRLAYADTTTGIAWANAVQRIRNGANTNSANWNTEAVNPISDAANQQKIFDLIKLPLNYYSGIAVGGTQDNFAKGVEVQMTYNPTPNWTIKFTGDKQRATYNKVVPQYDQWLAQRLPFWTTNAAPEIADFTDGGGVQYSLKNFWTGYGFTNVAQRTDAGGNTSPQAYFNNVVVSQVALAKALEGVTSPDQRKYHASLLTNYRFGAGRLKGFAVGGSERWESKAAVGFLGKAADATQPTVINVADPSRPIYDSGNYYTDLWIGYSRKVFRDRIGLKVQLNINNAFESGGLQATAVNFDGSPWSYRIIDPRQFVLTTTFTF